MKKSNYFKWLLAIATMLQFNFAFAQSSNCETFVTPSVSIVSDQNSVCQGMPLTFTATPINGGTAPLYQWFYNGVAIGQLNSTEKLVISNILNGDVVWVELTSSEPCVGFRIAVSNRINVIVYPIFFPEIIGTDKTICRNVIPNPIKVITPINFPSNVYWNWYQSLDRISWIRIADANDKTLTFKEPLKKTTFFKGIVYVNGTDDYCPGAFLTDTLEIKVADSPECQPTFTNDQTIEATKTVLGIYNIQGMEVDENHKGLLLYKYTDGSISKMLRE